MILSEKKYFLKNATMLYDTREKENFEVLKAFAHLGVGCQKDTFHTGDYGFVINDIDYRSRWLAERKGSLNEVYGNIMAKNLDDKSDKRNNLEEEFDRMKEAKIEECLLFIQGINNFYEVRNWKNVKAFKQGDRAGEHIYSTIMSWECSNRYGFKVVCQKEQFDIGLELVARAYYFWRNDMKQKYGDNFIKVIQA